MSHTEILVLMLFAILLDIIAGHLLMPIRQPRPFYRLARAMARRLDRGHYSREKLLLRGFVMSFILAGLAGLIGRTLPGQLAKLGNLGNPGYFLLLPILMVHLDFGLCRVQLLKAARALEQKDGATLRRLADQMDPPLSVGLDNHGIARKIIEHVTLSMVRNAVAPVFWLLLFGLPGLLVHGAIHAAAQGSRAYLPFGLAPARLQDAIDFLPARITALIMLLATVFSPGANIAGAWRCLRDDSGRHRSLNDGLPLAVMAGALHLALAGPSDHPHDWIGPGSARIEAGDCRRACWLEGATGLLLLLALLCPVLIMLAAAP